MLNSKISLSLENLKKSEKYIHTFVSKAVTLSELRNETVVGLNPRCAT